MAIDVIRTFEFTGNGACQLLAKFNTPLIKTVDVPDDPLHKDLVFVESNELAQCSWCQLRIQK